MSNSNSFRLASQPRAASAGTLPVESPSTTCPQRRLTVSRADCCSTPCTPPSLNSSPDGLCGLLETTAFFDQSSLALCSASRLLTTAHGGIPVFYNWLGVFCLGFQIQSCIFQKWAVSSKQLMLVRLCGLDNQEEPFDFLT